MNSQSSRQSSNRRTTRAAGPQRPRVLEKHIQETCTQYLELDGWRALKTDPCSDRARGKGFGEKGMADHLYLRYDCRRLAEVMWIEYKRPKGTLSLHQKIWHEAERARGAFTAIAGIDFEPTIEGFVEWYRASGFNRGRV